MIVLGITGAVSVGKTTMSYRLASTLSIVTGYSISIMSSDDFLYSNSTLESKNLAKRKGFESSYDMIRMRESIEELDRLGRTSTNVYSHSLHDLLSDRKRTVRKSDILILEGLNVEEFCDILVYIDADIDSIYRWYVDRCGKKEFYKVLYGWNEINIENLAIEISNKKKYADIVLEKESNHYICEFDTFLNRLCALIDQKAVVRG